MMHHSCDGIFVGSGIFGAEEPEQMGNAIVEAVNNWDDPDRLAEIATTAGSGMKGQATIRFPRKNGSRAAASDRVRATILRCFRAAEPRVRSRQVTQS